MDIIIGVIPEFGSPDMEQFTFQPCPEVSNCDHISASVVFSATPFFAKVLVSIVIMADFFSCSGNRLDCTINKINT